MKDKYEFGKCKNCGKETTLKNNYCKDCQDKKIEMPDVFKDIFGAFDDDLD
jgi:uncharacterized OB-fold protein